MDDREKKFSETFRLSPQEETYLWIVDIVGYSKIHDQTAQQIPIQNLFNGIYHSVKLLTDLVRKDHTKASLLTSDDATVIWTGDGAIVCLKKPFDLSSPLQLSYFFEDGWNSSSIWEEYKNVARVNEIPKLHIAVHYGNCRWLQTPTLRSPIFEVSNCFGVPINELARYAIFSSDKGEFVASKHFRDLFEERNEYLKIKVSTNATTKIHFEENRIEDIKGVSYTGCFFNFEE